jgi:hypothetical protein
MKEKTIRTIGIASILSVCLASCSYPTVPPSQTANSSNSTASSIPPPNASVSSESSNSAIPIQASPKSPPVDVKALIGKWQSVDNSRSRIQFYKDGRFTTEGYVGEGYSVRLRGKYEILFSANGDQLRLDYSPISGFKFSEISLSKDKMVLTNMENGSVENYKRVK